MGCRAESSEEGAAVLVSRAEGSTRSLSATSADLAGARPRGRGRGRGRGRREKGPRKARKPGVAFSGRRSGLSPPPDPDAPSPQSQRSWGSRDPPWTERVQASGATRPSANSGVFMPGHAQTPSPPSPPPRYGDPPIPPARARGQDG